MKHRTTGNYLRTHRKKSGLSQREMGTLLGYKDSGQVSRHERSSSIPPLAAAPAYELIFRVPVSAIFIGMHGSVERDTEHKLQQLEAELHNRSAADDRLLAAGYATFTYDANGNQTSVSRALGSQPITYRYDAANRLVGATSGRTISSFAYDGDGNRITQSVGPGTYSYLTDVATPLPVVLQESGPDGNISYAYGLDLISESSPTFNYFYHYDGLGSVIALTDASGRPSAAYVYDPWGNPLLAIPDIVGTRNKFRFTGEAFDPGTGLYYLRARYYDSSIGRMMTQDPHLGFIFSPFSENRYGYALGNPIRYADHSGFTAMDRDMGSQTRISQTAIVGNVTAGLFSEIQNWWDTVGEFFNNVAQNLVPTPVVSPTDVTNFGSVWAGPKLRHTRHVLKLTLEPC